MKRRGLTTNSIMHRTRTSRNINMAANWRKILEEHAILQPLVKYQERLSSITECKEWVVIRDGEMFLWNRNTGSVLTTNLKYSKLDLKVDSGRNTVHHVYKVSRQVSVIRLSKHQSKIFISAFTVLKLCSLIRKLNIQIIFLLFLSI